MITTKCYPKTRLDDALSKTSSFEDLGYSSDIIAHVRSWYDAFHSTDKDYESMQEKDLGEMTFNEIEEYASKLREFHDNMADQANTQISSTSTNLASRFEAAVSEYSKDMGDYKNGVSPTKVLALRAQSLALDVLAEAEAMKEAFLQERREKAAAQGKKYTNIFSKLDILKGIKTKEGVKFGEAEVFARVYNSYRAKYLQALNEGDHYKAREYRKILNNWGPLCMYARMQITKLEGIKLGAFNNYAAKQDLAEMEGIIDALEYYDVEEATKESWMERKDKFSAFNTLTQRVRAVLSSLFLPDSGTLDVEAYTYNYTQDDLGNNVLMNPMRVHNTLISIFRGMSSAKRMMQILEQESQFSGHATLTHTLICREIYNRLKENPELQTAFYTSYKKGFTKYNQLSKTIKEGIAKYNSISLNQSFSLGENEYSANILRGNILNPSNSLFKHDSKGKLYVSHNISTRLRKIFPSQEQRTEFDAIEKWEDKKAYLVSTLRKQLAKNETREQALNTLLELAEYLNISVTADQLLKMRSNHSLINFTKALVELYNPHFATSGMPLSQQKSIISNINIPFSSRYFAAKPSSKEEKDPSEYRKKVKSVYKYIDNARAAEYESRARIADRNDKTTTVYSDQLPCFFTDTIDTIKDFVESDNIEGLREYIKAKYGDSSYFIDRKTGEYRNVWLREWLKYDKGEFGLAATALDHYRYAQLDDSNKVIRFEELSSKEHAISLIQNFFYAGSYKEDRHFAYYPIFILGDSGVARFIKAPVYSVDQCIDYFVEVIFQEHELQKQLTAIDQALKSGEINPNNTVTGNKIVFREGLAAASKYNYKMLAFLGKSNAEIKELISSPDKDTIRQAVKDALLGDGKKVIGAVEKFKGELEKLGLLSLKTVSITETVDGKKVKKDIQVYSEFGKLPYFNGKTDVYVTPDNINEVLEFYVCNSRFAMSQQLQLMTVSPNFYKNIEELQKRYKEIHASGTALNPDASYTIQTKNGPVVVKVFNRKAVQRAAYFDDIVTDSSQSSKDFYSVAKKANPNTYEDYLTNTLTDGQSFRTIDSMRKIAIAQGLWDTNGNEELVYNTFLKYRREGKELPESIIKQITKLAVSFQPQKPFLYTFESFTYIHDGGIREDARIPVQHKCAEVILIPELLPKDSHLRALGEAMMDSNIDVVCSTTAVKVGNFGSTEIAYATNEQGLLINSAGEVLPGENGGFPKDRADQKKNPNFNKEISQEEREAGVIEDYYKPVNLGAQKIDGKEISMRDHFKTALAKSYVHELNLENYYRQQNVPNHVYDARAMGTQARKVFMDNIKLAGNHYERYLTTGGYKGKTVCIAGIDHDVSNAKGNGGANIVRFYNSLIVANIMDAFDALAEEVASSTLLSQNLQQLALNSTDETFYSLFDYALTGDEKFLIPLYERCKEYPTSAKLISLFKKRVQKQKMCGGSAVQASAFGIDEVVKDAHNPSDGGLKFECEYDADGEPINILWMECEMPFDFKYTDTSGKEIELNYDDYCNTDGTLKTTVDKDGNKIALLDRDFPGIRELIAYRIPTERAYSMMNLKIKKFSRKENGGIIRVPAEGTTIAGFDFDIDKLYFLRREFKYKGLSKTDTKAVWDQIYEDYPELSRRLFEKQRDLSKVNKATSTILKASFSTSKTVSNLSKEIDDHLEDPKHSYWDMIDLEGISSDIQPGMSKEEFFQQQLIKQGKEKGIKIQYDYTKDAREQLNKDDYKHVENWRRDCTVARNNEIFNLLWHRLSDQETLESRLTPGGFPSSSDASKEIRILSNPDYSSQILKANGTIDRTKLAEMIADKENDYKEQMDVLDPMTMIKYNQQNQIAGTLIGIFANHNCNHMFASMAKELRCPKAISFCGHSFSDLLHNPDSSKTLAEFLAASVDAVKDPVLNFLNLNKHTANTGVVLARLGYTPREIGLLFNQPIIKKACELAASDRYLDLQGAIEQVAKDCNFNLSNVSSEFLSEDILMKSIISYSKTSDQNAWIEQNALVQRAALAVFLQASKYAQSLTTFVGSTKFTASNAIGSDWGSLYHSILIVDKHIRTQASNSEDKLIIVACDSNPVGIQDSSTKITDPDVYYANLMENPFAFEQCMYDCLREYMTILCDKKTGFFPYEHTLYKGIRNGLNMCTRSEILPSEEINNIHEYIQEKILQELPGSLFDGNTPISILNEEGNKVAISRKEYYKSYFPNILYSLLTNKKADIISPQLKHELLSFISFSSVDGNITGLSVRNIMLLGPEARMEFTNLWAVLANSENMADRALARDLFLYCFHNYGFQMTPESFIRLSPPNVKQLIEVLAYNSSTGQLEMMPYTNFLNEAMYGASYNYSINDPTKVDNFIHDYIIEHPDNYLYTYSPKGKDTEACKEAFSVKDGILTVDMKIAGDKGILHKIEINKTTNTVKYMPCISYGGKLYEISMENSLTGAVSENAAFNEFSYTRTTPTHVTYKEVKTLELNSENEVEILDAEFDNVLKDYQNVITKMEVKYEFKDAEFITSDMQTSKQYVVGIDIRGEVKEKLYLASDNTMKPRC